MPDPVLLTRGSESAQAISNGANRDTDVFCGGDATLVVQAELTAGAAGDLAVQVLPFEADNATVAPIAVPPTQSVGPTLAAGKSYYYGQFDVQALEKVRIRITNNNAAPQTINRWSWRLQ
jgi:hypothetical protein